MFQVYTSTAYSKSVRATFDSIDAALAYLTKIGCIHIEADGDHPGCYDAMTKFGEVLSIEPLPSRAEHRAAVEAGYASLKGYVEKWGN